MKVPALVALPLAVVQPLVASLGLPDSRVPVAAMDSSTALVWLVLAGFSGWLQRQKKRRR
jgi:hypothetical protein